MTNSKLQAKISKRFRPLYAAAFFHGFVLWYPIEKIFMKDIGFNDAGIGIMIAFYSAIMLLAETPSGILADRWSRKGVLMLASIFLALASLIGGISDSPAIYLISSAMWGMFFAMYSGTYESIVYDTVLEEGMNSSEYEKYYGKVNMIDSTALVLGSLLGGLTAATLGLNYAYILTIPLTILSLIVLSKFKEPQLHKSEVYTPIMKHIRNTFRSVLQKGQLAPVLTVLISGSVLTYMTFEFSQVWLIALAASVIWFGPINALHLSTIGIGGYAAANFKISRYRVALFTLSLLMLGSFGLIFSRNLAITAVSIALVSACVITLRIVFGRLMHDALSSTVRAGAASAVSTLGRVIIIPLSLSFGYISETTSIFDASWIIFALSLVVAIYTIKTYSKNPQLTSK